jgi:hypothetical protein
MFGQPSTKGELCPPSISYAGIDSGLDEDGAGGHPLATLQANCIECKPSDPANFWESPPIQRGLGDARRTPALLEQLPVELLGEFFPVMLPMPCFAAKAMSQT